MTSPSARCVSYEGWFFPYRTNRVGCNGVIINKKTGRAFQLGSAFPVDRDLALYDRGYQSAAYDLVILKIRDLDETVRTLRKLRFSTVEPTYEHRQVWRIARDLTDAEIRARLAKLPCIFTGSLYFHLEHLDQARDAGWFTFEALEFRGPRGMP